MANNDINDKKLDRMPLNFIKSNEINLCFKQKSNTNLWCFIIYSFYTTDLSFWQETYSQNIYPRTYPQQILTTISELVFHLK